MSDATIHIRSEADAVKADLADIARGVNDVNESLEQSANKWTSVGKQMMIAGGILTGVLTVPIVAFFKGAITTAAEFEQAMAGVEAISGATGDTFNSLAEQAKLLGSTTRYTAVEAAQGMTMLARAGWEANDILSAMPGLLNLAAAGSVDLAIAADIVSDVMMAFGAHASEATIYADVFAKAAASANTTVEALGQAMAYAAPAAAAAGYSIQTTAAALSALADAGVKGTRAGTTMDSVLRELRNKVKDGTLDFGAFTVAVYDNEGAMRDLFDVIGDIESAMQGMTQQQKDAALGTVFTTRSLRGMNIWLTRGVDSLIDLENGLMGASGAADVMSSIMMDTLQGSIIELQSAMEGLKIAFGEFFLSVGQNAIRSLTDVVRWITNADDATKKTIITMAAIAASIGPLLTLIGALGIGIKALTVHFAFITSTVLPVTAAFLALGFLIAGITKTIIDEGIKAQQAYERMASTIIAETEQIGKVYAAQHAEMLHGQAARHVDEIQAEIDHLIAMGHTVDNSKELVDAYKRLNAAIAEENAAFRLAELLKDAAFKASLAAAPDVNEMLIVWNGYLAARDATIIAETEKTIGNYMEMAKEMKLGEDVIAVGLDSIYRWSGEMRAAAVPAANRVMVDVQAEFAKGGKIFDYETGTLMPIQAGINAGLIAEQFRSQLGVLPADVQVVAADMIDKFGAALAKGNVGIPEAIGWAVEISELIAAEGVHWEQSTHFALGQVMATFKTQGPEVVNAWREEFGEIDTVTEEVWDGTMKTLAGILAGPYSQDVKLQAMQLMGKMGEGFEDASPDVLASMETLLGSIEAHLLLLDWGPAAEALSSTFGLSLVTGMSAYTDDIIRVSQDTGKTIITSIEDVLGMQSPSKVMLEIGKNVAQSLADGITGSVIVVVDAITTFSQKVTNALSDIKSTVNASFDEVWGDMANTAKNGLDKVMSVFNDMDNRISSSMGNIVSTISNNINIINREITNFLGRITNINSDTLQNIVDNVIYTVTTIVNMVRNMGSNLTSIAASIGRNFVDGIMSHLRRLPDDIWQILRSIVYRLMSAGSEFYRAAVNLGRSLWEGFKSGMGIRSPSYIEKALYQITNASKDALVALNKDAKAMTALQPPMLYHTNRGKTSQQNNERVPSQINTYHVHVGTLIADDQGLKELERSLLKIRKTEARRVAES